MGWRRWKDSLSSLCLATGQLLPRRLLESLVSLFWQWLLFWALLFCCLFCIPQCHLPSCLLLCPIQLPHPSSHAHCFATARVTDCARVPEPWLPHVFYRLFPFITPWQVSLGSLASLYPLLIYKPKYIHSSASTGLILSKTHSSFNVQLKWKQSLLRRDVMALREPIALAYPCPKFLGLLPSCPQSRIPFEPLEATSPRPRGQCSWSLAESSLFYNNFSLKHNSLLVNPKPPNFSLLPCPI